MRIDKEKKGGGGGTDHVILEVGQEVMLEVTGGTAGLSRQGGKGAGAWALCRGSGVAGGSREGSAPGKGVRTQARRRDEVGLPGCG